MKNNIAKILGVVLTVVTLASVLVVAAPVSAAAPTPQAWSNYAIPSTTGMVLNTAITVGGPIAQASDASALYAYITDTTTTPNKIISSLDNGRTWKNRVVSGGPTAPVVEIVCSPTEANVVFYITAATMFMSTDSGVNFTAIVNIPTGSAFTSFDVAKWSGRYIAVVGTNMATVPANAGVYYWDQSLPFNNLTPVGTSIFSSPVGAWMAPGDTGTVLTVRMSPTFATDRVVVAVGFDTTTNTTMIRMDVNGGAWGAVVPDLAAAIATTGATTADIAFPSDFNYATSPIYFVAIAAPTNGGIYRLIGNVQTSVDSTRTVTNLSYNGSFASATATVLAGTSVGTVGKSSNSGNTFAFSGAGSISLRSNVYTTAWVLLDKNYATSKMAWILNVGNLQGALNVTTDGSTFNQWSLINETIKTANGIVDMAVAANGDVFMITSDNAPAANTTGTITTAAATPPSTNGVVTGVGTTFTPAMVGATLVTVGANTYTVAAVTSPTTLTLTTDVTVPEAGVTFTITYGNDTSLWRQLNSAGTPWERVMWNALAPTAVANRLTLAADYAANKDLAYWILNQTSAIKISTNNANSFTAMTTAPGTIVGGANNVQSLYLINATTAVVGDATGTIVTNQTSTGVTSAYWWTEVANSPFAAGYTVTSIVSAGGTNLLAAAYVNAAGVNTVKVAKSADNGVTWALLSPTAGNLNANLTITSAASAYFVQPADDYATTGAVYVAGGGGIFMYPSTSALAVNGWRLVSNAAPLGTSGVTGTAVGTATGLVTAPAANTSAEGTGMIFATDSSVVAPVVARIRGHQTISELTGPIPAAIAADTFFGLWAGPAVSGNIQLWTLDNTATGIWNYVDTLGVQGTGVTVSNLTTNASSLFGIVGASTSATVSWTALTNAAGYKVYVNSVQQNNLYTAANDLLGATVGGIPVPVAVAVVPGGTSALVSNMVPGVSYFVSIWANAPVSSFMFGTTINAPLPPPTAAVPLVPTLGAEDVDLQPGFAWAAVPGATSYSLQLTLATDTAYASPIINVTNIPAVAGQPTVTYNWTGAALSNNTSYIWRVAANLTGGGNSAWVLGNFRTEKVVTPPVTVTTQPQPTIIFPTAQPPVTVTINPAPPAPILTVTQPVITLTTPPAGPTPSYIWIIVGVGAVLTIAVIILIIRTRRVV